MSVKLRFNLARDLYEAFPAIREDLSAEPADQPSLDFLSELTRSKTPENALTFCAYLLPRREAVWWGHQCLQQNPEMLSLQDNELLQLAENWVRQSEEPERNIALGAAIDIENKSPGAWVALAAGWSGGSMVADDMNPVPPPPHLTAKAVNIALLSTLANIAITSRRDVLKSFVEIGTRLVQGEQSE